MGELHLELPAFLSSFHSPSLQFGISVTSNFGTNLKMLRWVKVISRSLKQRNNTSSGPFSSHSLLMDFMLISSALSPTTEMPSEVKKQKRQEKKRKNSKVHQRLIEKINLSLKTIYFKLVRVHSLKVIFKK